MSRAKFDDWTSRKWPLADADDATDRMFVLLYEAWQAGRASMREEAAEECESRAVIAYEFLSDACKSPQEVSDLECHECAAAIRSIQA